MWTYNNPDELYHYGVLGMKWGRRKNSYTSKDHRRVKYLTSKKTNQLSNKELSEINKRYNLESQYKNYKNQKSIGRNAVKSFVSIAGGITATAGAYEVYKKYGAQILDKMLKK